MRSTYRTGSLLVHPSHSSTLANEDGSREVVSNEDGSRCSGEQGAE